MVRAQPCYSDANIRFQQPRSLPREMKRTDSMPLYLLPLAAWSFKASYLPLILLLLLPGVYVSGVILVRGVRKDYAHHVEGLILRPGYPGRLLFPGNFVS